MVPVAYSAWEEGVSLKMEVAPIVCLKRCEPLVLESFSWRMSLTSKIIKSMGRQTHNMSELHCNFKLSILAKQEPNFKFATAKSSK